MHLVDAKALNHLRLALLAEFTARTSHVSMPQLTKYGKTEVDAMG
jgi:hypothetical protein